MPEKKTPGHAGRRYQVEQRSVMAVVVVLVVLVVLLVLLRRRTRCLRIALHLRLWRALVLLHIVLRCAIFLHVALRGLILLPRLLRWRAIFLHAALRRLIHLPRLLRGRAVFLSRLRGRDFATAVIAGRSRIAVGIATILGTRLAAGRDAALDFTVGSGRARRLRFANRI